MAKNENKIEERKKRVLEEKLKNPTKTQRELADDIGAGLGTINRDLEALEHDGTLQTDKTINAIKDADLEIVILGQSLILDKMRDEEEQKKMNIRDISAVAKDSQVRYSFLAGENSKKDGGEKKNDYGRMTDEELLSLIRR